LIDVATNVLSNTNVSSLEALDMEDTPPEIRAARIIASLAFMVLPSVIGHDKAEYLRNRTPASNTW
jgi:hypothetical protein